MFALTKPATLLLAIATLCVLCIPGRIAAQHHDQCTVIDEWLHLGPASYPTPVYSDVPRLDGTTWSVRELLNSQLAEYASWVPAEGLVVPWNRQARLRWSTIQAEEMAAEASTGTDDALNADADSGGWVRLSGPDEQSHQVAWLAIHLRADRFMKRSLRLKSPYMLRVFLNGEALAAKTSLQGEEDASAGSLSTSLTLEQGQHVLLIKALRPAGEHTAQWQVAGHLSPEGITCDEMQEGVSTASESAQSDGQTPEVSRAAQSDGQMLEPSLSAQSDTQVTGDPGTLALRTSPLRMVKQSDLMNAPRPGAVSVSDQGDLAAIVVREDNPPDGQSETRIDIRSLPDGELVRRFSGAMTFSGMQWVPGGRSFSYTTQGVHGTDLWVVDLDSGDAVRVLSGVSDFAGYSWAPGAESIIYSIRERHTPGQDGVVRYHGLQDRRPGFHNRTFLYELDVPSGTTRRLTTGRLSTSLADIHPDGDRLLFVRSHEVYDQRPYGKTEYVLLDLNTLQTDSLFTISFGGAARFSPDGNSLLVTGGPNAFGEIGVAVPDTMIANDYDTQAYLYNLSSREIEPLTREFDPAVSSASWDTSGRYIYLTATEGAYVRLFRLDVRTKNTIRYESGPDVAGGLQLARNRDVAVFTGSGASDPPKVWQINFSERRPEARMLYDPGAEAYAAIQFGQVRSWTFENSNGETIDGHVYYPPDFDATASYPVIVYYYGGTVPTSRAFAGRYPKELYAANGYLVYVVQPSGATGFGQEFSARHVNDWGEIAGREIITGVEAFLDAHSYADRARVGAIGASYGGYMTMYLLTQTDLFAAAVSHAGISNLASYWGEGFWGYQYSGVATAGSYPWNRQDIYTGRSPLFNADRIHTPLLLVTGMSDTNVPPGESLQMFTALKLLGREVAFVAVDNQDHHILDYRKNRLWKQSILSWFDKWLKEQPDWWETLHGE